MLTEVFKPFLLIGTTDQILIILICTLCAYILREIMDVSIMAMAIMVPTFFAGSVYSVHLFRQYKLLMIGPEEIQIMGGSAVGIAMVFFLYCLGYSIYGSFTEQQVSTMVSKRGLKNQQKDR